MLGLNQRKTKRLRATVTGSRVAVSMRAPNFETGAKECAGMEAKELMCETRARARRSASTHGSSCRTGERERAACNQVV